MFEAFRRHFSTDLAIDLGTANTVIYVRHRGNFTQKEKEVLLMFV
jgi:actin-like ATPase involved in cell morphogenesis